MHAARSDPAAAVRGRVDSLFDAAGGAGAQRAAWAVAIGLAVLVFVYFVTHIFRGDAYDYWLPAHGAPAYLIDDSRRATVGFVYSPAFLQLIWPLVGLPWRAFYAVWLALGIATLVWLARPWLAIVLLAASLFTFHEALLNVPRHSLASMNVSMFMGLAIALGFRWPWTWTLLVLTKVTPGVGVLWFLVRREWRNFAIAVGATAGVVLVSFVIAPTLWMVWLAVLQHASTYGDPPIAYRVLPFWPRLAIAIVLIVVGALRDAKWVLPIACVIAMPFVYDTVLIILLSVAPLLRRDWWIDGTARAQTARRGPATAFEPESEPESEPEAASSADGG